MISRRSSLDERNRVAPALPDEFLGLLAGHSPVSAFPIDVGAQLSRVRLSSTAIMSRRLIPLLERGQSARLEQCPADD
jgi:hypothetical protein